MGDGNRVEEGEICRAQGWEETTARTSGKTYDRKTYAGRGDWVTSRRAFLVEWWDAGQTTGG